MRKIIIDGRYMKDKEEVHMYLKEKLDILGYYGNNLDALWDALSFYNESIDIILVNEYDLIENLADYGFAIIEVFKDAREENKNISFQIIEG